MKPLTDAMLDYIEEHEYQAYEAQMNEEPPSKYFQWKEGNQHLSDFHRYKFSYPPSD